MEILINELSLTGQFKNENKFLDNFDRVLELIKFIDKLNFSLLKEYNFFKARVTAHSQLDDFLKLRNDRARKMKQFLLKLAYHPPYWNDTKKHNCYSDNYTYISNNICDTSLAESCERDKVILSFTHDDFLNTDIEIKKNTTSINIYNFIDKSNFLNYLLSISKIEPLEYCQLQFENSKLNFSLLETGYGFNSLETAQQKEEFLNAFHDFSEQDSWENILKSDGLEYKKYNKPKKKKILGWFREGKYANTDIYKFRVTQKYRCFGYRENDDFFVLRFEIDHKISDNG